MSIVVAIAALPGGGKTTVVHRLVERLGDAVAIHLDHYEQVTRRSFEETLDWVRRGADCNELDIPGLADDLARLKRGETVVDAGRGRTLEPRRYIVLETLYGREHQASGVHIDRLVWLEVPPDLALARTLRAMAGTFRREPTLEARAAAVDWMATYLENYMAGIRDALALARERIPKQADRVVDGTAPVEAVISDLAGWIEDELA